MNSEKVILSIYMGTDQLGRERYQKCETELIINGEEKHFSLILEEFHDFEVEDFSFTYKNKEYDNEAIKDFNQQSYGCIIAFEEKEVRNLEELKVVLYNNFEEQNDPNNK